MAKISTRNKIKIAAQKLFAEKGMDGVSVREIVAAAEQKNMASLHYYFRTKQDLARELLLDAAAVIEVRRVELLDELEANGGPKSAREVLSIFIESAILPETDPRSLTNVRLYLQAFQNNPNFVQETVNNTGDIGYFRCLAHLKIFMSDINPETMARRLYLMQHYVFNLLAARERAISNNNPEAQFWEGEGTLSELVRTAEAMLLAPDN
ncbi:MAG: TetR/AcrR family transcriptional regulator [Proteobacteria bacterium]|nr:TetR/AcrR family transcriptional regulator [Pseudomonadota bacterium]